MIWSRGRRDRQHLDKGHHPRAGYSALIIAAEVFQRKQPGIDAGRGAVTFTA